ncbi:MAG TPA: transporter suffix domain-containing protein [Rubrobacteraceae bacterium]|nr:transporter suffix domain-containing protein [Rubrobacteraceae bacterium]
MIPAALTLSTLAVPFLPLPTEVKVWTVSGLLISTEVVFWGAALYFGGEVAARYRRFFNPRNWFGKKRR